MTRSDEDYIEAVKKHSPASTREVAEEVGVTRQGADYRLRKLESEGQVRSERIGNSLAWFLSK
ncbi:winged helix-turn-helix transcriptional regulator [Halocatena salina]|uniref:Winged helix-turn-helix transcriptional regulator n=1 Tax=Halocatena salina TaxID=2934340 RepID=A0A8U0A254_9EURY|nr:winged helix-turn-helix transcriptional regulator [Halocatena salina]UPM42859.1 winged helix-turn-helix transcriptional regulator [Halocatena salina]